MIEKRTVLIIDDEHEFVNLMKLILTQENYHVLTAYDGKQGLKIVAIAYPDLVVLDIRMPNMDGFAFYREMSNITGKTKVPILIVTARGELEPVFRQVGVDGFITKPFKMTDFLKEVERILAEKEKP